MSTIVALQKITKGLDDAIGGVGEIIEKTAPVGDVVNDDQRQPRRGRRRCSRACSSRRPGCRTRSAWSTGCTRAPRRDGLRNFPDSKTTTAPRISEVYTSGTLTLARLGREAPIAAASPDGPVLRNPAYGSLAARLLYPEIRQDAAVEPAALAGHRDRLAGAVRASETPGVRNRMPAAATAERSGDADSRTV